MNLPSFHIKPRPRTVPGSSSRLLSTPDDRDRRRRAARETLGPASTSPPGSSRSLTRKTLRGVPRRCGTPCEPPLPKALPSGSVDAGRRGHQGTQRFGRCSVPGRNHNREVGGEAGRRGRRLEQEGEEGLSEDTALGPKTCRI